AVAGTHGCRRRRRLAVGLLTAEGDLVVVRARRESVAALPRGRGDLAGKQAGRRQQWSWFAGRLVDVLDRVVVRFVVLGVRPGDHVDLAPAERDVLQRGGGGVRVSVGSCRGQIG